MKRSFMLVNLVTIQPRFKSLTTSNYFMIALRSKRRSFQLLRLLLTLCQTHESLHWQRRTARPPLTFKK